MHRKPADRVVEVLWLGWTIGMLLVALITRTPGWIVAWWMGYPSAVCLIALTGIAAVEAWTRYGNRRPRLKVLRPPLMFRDNWDLTGPTSHSDVHDLDDDCEAQACTPAVRVQGFARVP
jgi:hypothetical protein